MSRTNEQPKATEGSVDSNDLLNVTVEDLPKHREHYMLVYRYTKGKGDWYTAGGLHKNAIDAEADNARCSGAEVKLLRVILPI